jgi:ATP synthase protein I
LSEENNIKNEIKSLEAKIEALKEPKEAKRDFNATNGERVIAELLAGIIVGTLLGIWLDDVFSTKPILTIIFIFLGLAGSIYNLYKASLKISDEYENTTSDK